MAYKFVEGAAYAAIPALEGAKRHMVVCTGRKGISSLPSLIG